MSVARDAVSVSPGDLRTRPWLHATDELVLVISVESWTQALARTLDGDPLCFMLAWDDGLIQRRLSDVLELHA